MVRNRSVVFKSSICVLLLVFFFTDEKVIHGVNNQLRDSAAVSKPITFPSYSGPSCKPKETITTIHPSHPRKSQDNIPTSKFLPISPSGLRSTHTAALTSG